MKTKMLRKKLVVFLLSFMMIIGFIPVTSLAADTETVTITIPSTMHVQSGKLTVTKGERMDDLVLTIDEDYHENVDFVKEINNNYQTYGIGIRSDVYYPPTFTISGRPNCDIDLTNMAIPKEPQAFARRVEGREPKTEGGKGYLKAIENTMEYRQKGTTTWISSNGCAENSYQEEVDAGYTYEVRFKTTWTKLPSDSVDVYVPRYGQSVKPYGFLKVGSYSYDGNAHTCEPNENYVIIDGITTATDADTYIISVIPAGDKTWTDGTRDAKSSVWKITKADQNAPSGLSAIKPSSTGAADGKITGVNETMEYCKSGDSTWNSCTGTEITGLTAGDYDVRLKEDKNHNAGSTVVVTVPDGDTLVPEPIPTPEPNPTPETPTIIEGANGTYTQGGQDGISFRSNDTYSNFQKVLVDGNEVASENYTTREGSIIVTLKPEYLSTLAAGTHSISIVSAGGIASTDFTVQTASTPNPTPTPSEPTTSTPSAPATEPASSTIVTPATQAADESAQNNQTTESAEVSSPKTAEDNSVALCTTLLIVSCAGLAGMFVRRKKNA